MVSRTNRRTGEEFLGCLAYPKCKGTVQSARRYPLCPICGKSMSVHSNDSSWGLEDVLSCGDELTDEKGIFTGYCRGYRKILTAPWNCPFCAKELVEVGIEDLIIRSYALSHLHKKRFWTTDSKRVTGFDWRFVQDLQGKLTIEACTKLRESESIGVKFRLVNLDSPLLEKHYLLHNDVHLNHQWDQLCKRVRDVSHGYSAEHGKPWYWNELNTYLACPTRGCNGLRVLRPGSADHEAYSERNYRIEMRRSLNEPDLEGPNYTDENQEYFHRTVTNSRGDSEDLEPLTLRERIEALRQMPKVSGFNPTADDIEYFEYLEQYPEELRIGRTSREARFTRDWKCVECATNFELSMEPESVPEIWWTWDKQPEINCPKCRSSRGTIPIVSHN